MDIYRKRKEPAWIINLNRNLAVIDLDEDEDELQYEAGQECDSFSLTHSSILGILKKQKDIVFDYYNKALRRSLWKVTAKFYWQQVSSVRKVLYRILVIVHDPSQSIILWSVTIYNPSLSMIRHRPWSVSVTVHDPLLSIMKIDKDEEALYIYCKKSTAMPCSSIQE